MASQQITSPQALGTSDATGKVTLRFPSPPLGYAWTGTVSVAGSTPSAKWTPSLDGAPQAAFYGASQGGPYQAFDSQVLSLVGVGLQPNTPYQAIWSATQDPKAEAPTVPPSTLPTTVATTRPALILDTVPVPSGSNFSRTYVVDPNARALTFLWTRTAGVGLLTLIVTGVTSGLQYTTFVPAPPGQRPPLSHVEINPSIDGSFTVTFQTPVGTAATVFVAEDFDPMVIGVESFSDTNNVIVELVQKTPTESRVVCTHNANTRIVAAGAAGYNRGFEVMVPYGTAVDANGVSCLVNLGAAASATLGKGLVPGGFYARTDYNGDIDVWNTSPTTDFSIDLTVWF